MKMTIMKEKAKNMEIHWSGKLIWESWICLVWISNFYNKSCDSNYNFTFWFRLVLGLLKITKKQEEKKKKNVTLDILQPSRYKPNDLEQMAKDTRFTKEEVRYLYRAFKQECPNGIVDEETFKDVYEKIFPLGDASHYAHLVFAAIDR